MSTFRSKPTTIQAEQYTGDWENRPKGVYANFQHGPYVQTIQGVQVAVKPGEWIVTEPDGIHHYPVQDEVFQSRWELVE